MECGQRAPCLLRLGGGAAGGSSGAGLERLRGDSHRAANSVLYSLSVIWSHSCREVAGIVPKKLFNETYGHAGRGAATKRHPCSKRLFSVVVGVAN